MSYLRDRLGKTFYVSVSESDLSKIKPHFPLKKSTFVIGPEPILRKFGMYAILDGGYTYYDYVQAQEVVMDQFVPKVDLEGNLVNAFNYQRPLLVVSNFSGGIVHMKRKEYMLNILSHRHYKNENMSTLILSVEHIGDIVKWVNTTEDAEVITLGVSKSQPESFSEKKESSSKFESP